LTSGLPGAPLAGDVRRVAALQARKPEQSHRATEKNVRYLA
jgi:hypothetical protein